MSLRSRITFCPTLLAQYVWITPKPPPMTAMQDMTATIFQSRSMSGPPVGGNKAESNTTLMSRGFTTPRPAVMRIRNPTREHPVPVGYKKGDDPPKWPVLRGFLLRWGNVKRRFVFVGIVRGLAGDRRGWRLGVAA